MVKEVECGGGEGSQQQNPTEPTHLETVLCREPPPGGWGLHEEAVPHAGVAARM